MPFISDGDNFILLGGASYFTLATLYADMFASTQTNFSDCWTIGIKHPRIAQAAQGEMGGSFDTGSFSMAGARRS